MGIPDSEFCGSDVVVMVVVVVALSCVDVVYYEIELPVFGVGDLMDVNACDADCAYCAACCTRC